MPVSHEVTLRGIEHDDILLKGIEYDDIVLKLQEILPVDAVSPRVQLERVDGGVLIRIQDIQGLHTANVYDGQKGDKGEKGDKGDTGPKGEKGDTGNAFYIVKTYPSIAEMNADYSGTDVKIGEFVLIASSVTDPDNAKVFVKGDNQYNFIVDLSGSEGIQGPKGEQGDKGDKGDVGEQGPQGEKGDTGPRGPQGIQGERGPQGIQGPRGIQGATGPAGPAGVGVPTGGTTGQVLAKASGTNYDTEWVDQSGGSTIPIATNQTLGGIIVGDHLEVTEEGILSVTVANSVAGDNTNPITAAAVYTEVGNINALLATI